MNEDYTYLYDYQMRMADLQDIAAMDRMAAELRPQSALSRWADQRANLRRFSQSRGRSSGLGRGLGRLIRQH